MASKGPPGSLVRRSWSRPDSAGGRKEIPLTASLESLTSSSQERHNSSDKPGTAPGRSKTPVGAAAPRRSVSANRSSITQTHHHQQQWHDDQHGVLSDDDSLVLYKDPSGVSEQRSQASVVSGRHQMGETFFTALRRGYSYESSEHEHDSPAESQTAAGGLSCIDSQLNPIQSPNSSAYFTTAAPDSEYFSAAGSLQEGYSEAGSLATCNSSYVTPADASAAAAAEGGLVATASVVDVINSLYCLQATGPQGQQQQLVQKWHELDQDGRPLVPPSSAGAGADGVTPKEQLPLERSEVSSVGSNDPAAPDVGEFAAADDGDAQDKGQALAPECLPLQNGKLSQGQSNKQHRPTAESTCGVAEASRSSSASDSSGVFHSLAQEDVLPETSTQEASSVQHEGQVIKGSPVQQEAVGELRGSTDPAHDRNHATTYLTKVKGLLSERAALQAELGVYVQQLTSKTDGDGQQLLDMPADYNLMVERMLCERRSQYEALQGWEGPHRFDDLPVAQLPVSHDDPRVSAGLEVIRQLDVQLKEVWLKALVAARDAAPEQWAESERQRLARRAAQLDEGLAKERQKRLHAARLLRALNKLDEDGGLADGRGLNSYTYYQLKPEDKQVLAAVLNRNTTTLEQDNPFDASSAVLDDSSLKELTTLTAQLTQQSSRCLSAVGSSLNQSTSMLLLEYAEGHMHSAGQEVADPSADVEGQHTAGEGSIQSCRPSTAATDVGAENNRPRHTLTEIDALLLALQPRKQQVVEPLQAASQKAGGSCVDVLGNRKSSRSIAASNSKMLHARSGQAAGNQVLRVPHTTTSAGSAAIQDIDIDRQQKSSQADHIREQREARELRERELVIDAQLRALRTSELPKPSPEQLQALILECKQACDMGSDDGMQQGLAAVTAVLSAVAGCEPSRP